MKSTSRFSLAISLLVLLSRPATGTETNHNFAQWENEIAVFEKSDLTNPPPKGGIEFIGSSMIRRWMTLTQDFPGQPVYNRGFGGSEIMDSTHFAPRIIFPYAPRMIVFRAGGNDLWAGKPPEEVFADFQEFAATVHAKLPATEIVYIAWSPTPSRWKQHEAEKKLNGLVKYFCEETPHLRYLEAYDLPLGADGRPRPELFVADQLHFNAKGYRLLADRVRLIFSQ
jgi:hypothetical protein